MPPEIRITGPWAPALNDGLTRARADAASLLTEEALARLWF
ncbi:hypothetical protein ACIOKD_40795 [Streptomyces sp. NPDC087844]